ncbi:MAG: DNA polymerase III subunit delta [Brachyspira sp.]|nr:DNA polymerase III subunit delta [Brachyspira sp.]
MAVYFFYGEEDFNIEQEIEKLKKGLDKNFLEMSFKTYDNPKFPDLISILRTQPMMFGKMLVVINCLDYFSKTFDDKEIKQIAEVLEENNDNLDIVFVAQLKRDEGKKLDSRKKFFKTLSKYNAQEFAVIPTYKTAELEGWIIKQAKAKKLKMDTGAATAMISQIGNNLRQLATELDKLQLMAYPQNVVTPDMVKEICISNEDLFAFSDYLLEGKKDLALREYRKLLEKKYCMEIVSTLQTMLRRWIILKAKSSECTPMELSRLTGQHEYVVKLTLQKLKKTNLKDLVKLKQNITEAEFKIKSGQAPNAEAEVENAFFG